MNIVFQYRDDGPLAVLLARALRLGGRVSPLVLTFVGMVPLALVLLLRDEADALTLVAAAWFVLCTSAAGNPESKSRLAWIVPPLLRGFEYAVLIRLTVMADEDWMPACYAFLGVLALHHYDMVYRLRHQSEPPPAWVNAIGGGWDGRVLAATVLALIGGDVLGAGLVIAAIVLAVVYVAESVNGWRRYSAGVVAVELDDEGLEQG
jgi:hypothetical protein